MKKLFFVMAAVAALLTSCSKDDTFGGPTRGKVTFEVSTPELATRAYGDGQTADNLYYAVYDVIENAMVKTNYATTDTTDDVTFGNDLKATVTIDLVEGRPYEVAFWAESANSPYIFNAEAKTDAEGNTVAEAKTVSYNPNTSLTANNEAYDAFFAYVPEDKVKVGQVVNVDLKRPFAQLNVATSDAKTAKELGVEVKATGIKVDAYTSFNLQTGAVSGKEELTFAMTDVDNDATTEKEYNIGTITANSKNYDWLTMNYILVNERETTDVTFLFEDTKGKADYERPYSSINVQRNYRTNIIGAILTDPTKFDVTIDKEFTTPDINEERGNSREVSTVDEINAALNTLINDSDPDNDINSVTLTGNITFGSTSSASLRDNSASLSTTTRAEASTDHITIPAGVSFTIDLNGYNITGTDNTEKSFGLIHTNGTLNIINSSSTESTIKLTATHNNGWSRYSSVISNNPGGLLTVGANVVIEHLGGTAMSYGIDNLTNGKGTSAITIIDGATIKSKYIAVRQFLNGVEATNELYVKSGSTLAGERSGIYFQSPSAKANTGKLVVENGATIGGAYLGITEGTTEWPVEVSIAASAVNNDRSKIESDDVPAGYSIVLEDGNYVVKEGYYVATADELQAALDVVPSGQTIHFVADITGDVTVTQKEGVKITILGQGRSYKGMITVDGKSARYETAGLTIKDIVFDAESVTGDACIRLGNGDNNSRYTNNVTVDGCTFDVPLGKDNKGNNSGVAGVKSYTGGDWNLTITNCTATARAHSLVQVDNVEKNFLIKDCKAYSKNGINLNQTVDVVIDNYTADVKGYAVRFGASSGGDGAAETYLIKNSSLKTDNSEGDAVIILRHTADNSTLTIENTTIDGTNKIENKATNATIIIDGVATVSSTEALAAVLNKGFTNINLTAGEYTIPAVAKNKTLTISSSTGNAADVTIEVTGTGAGEGGGQLDYNFDGSTVTFNNLTIKTNSQLYAGFARLSATYNNCIIQNTYNLGVGDSAFNQCTFNITNEYLRVGGAKTAVFEGCTFNTDGRAILVFQDGTSLAQTVTVKDCTFNATAAANTWNGIHVAAVSIDGSQGGTYVVNLEGTNTVDTDFNGLWQIKAGEANVTVNE